MQAAAVKPLNVQISGILKGHGRKGQISMTDAVKEGIKMAIIVGVILAFVICLFRGIGYILSKLVQDREEFDGWGVYVAELPKSYKKKPFAWVDRLIGKWFLGNVYQSINCIEYN